MRASSNRSRPLVVDAYESAKHFREVFTKKPVTEERQLPFTWPDEMQHVGDSLAVAYSSDKWKKPGDWELYKHLAESRNRAYVTKGFLYDYERQSQKTRILGPMQSFGGVPMPKQFAFLALFVEAHFSLFDGGTNKRPAFVNERVVRVLVGHAMLGGAMIRWSLTDPDMEDQPILFVYTLPDKARREPGGVHMIITGDELDIEADGIVG